MSQDKMAFEKFIAELDFQDIAHDTESIRNLYLRAWQAATVEANKRIVELQASNNDLREALTAIRVWCEQPDTDLEDSIGKLACEALSATPAESLQAIKEVK